MKAVVRETYGPPDVLHLEEVPVPAIGSAVATDSDRPIRGYEGCTSDRRPPGFSIGVPVWHHRMVAREEPAGLDAAATRLPDELKFAALSGARTPDV